MLTIIVPMIFPITNIVDNNYISLSLIPDDYYIILLVSKLKNPNYAPNENQTKKKYSNNILCQ